MAETEYMHNILHEVNYEIKRLLSLKMSIETVHNKEYSTRLKLQGLRIEVLSSFVHFADCVKYSQIPATQKLECYKNILAVVQNMSMD